MKIRILNAVGEVENVIEADEAFAEQQHPGRWEIDPAPADESPLPANHWWVYEGPFKDRLGMDALAIAASGHDACKGVQAMLSGRKYVDLKDPRVSAMLDILIATNQPAANPIFPGSGPMTAAKKLAILSAVPTDAERYRGPA